MFEEPATVTSVAVSPESNYTVSSEQVILNPYLPDNDDDDDDDDDDESSEGPSNSGFGVVWNRQQGIYIYPDTMEFFFPSR